MFEATDSNNNKKEHVQLAQAQVLLLTLGTQWGMLLAGKQDLMLVEQYMRLAKNAKKSWEIWQLSLQVDD